MNTKKSIETIQVELESLAFKKAKKAGLAIIPSQVKLTLRIKTQVFSTELTNDDWERLMKIDVSPNGKKLLEKLRLSKNRPVKEDFFEDWREKQTFEGQIRAYGIPMYVSQVSGLICIKKRLLRRGW